MVSSFRSGLGSHGHSLLATIWILYPFTAIMVASRFYVRYVRRSTGPDDWTMLFAWLLHSTSSGITSAMIARGSLHHIDTIPRDRLVWLAKYLMGVYAIGLWAVILGKIAIGLLILRLLEACRTKWRQQIIWFSIFLGIAVSVVNTFATFFQCDPPSALWDYELVANGQATCPRTGFFTKISICQSSVGIWMDFLLALVPTTFVFKLNMPLRQKIAICGLLGLGVFTSVCAIMKTMQFTGSLGNPDPTYASYPLFIWTNLEVSFVIIAGSVAPAKPIFDKLFFGKPIEAGFSSRMPSATPSKSSFRLPLWNSQPFGNGKSKSSRQPSADSGFGMEEIRQPLQVLYQPPEGKILTTKTFSVESQARVRY